MPSFVFNIVLFPWASCCHESLLLADRLVADHMYAVRTYFIYMLITINVYLSASGLSLKISLKFSVALPYSL